MRGFDFAGFEDRNKWRRSRGFLDRRTSARLFALDQACGADHLESELARGLDRLDS